MSMVAAHVPSAAEPLALEMSPVRVVPLQLSGARVTYSFPLSRFFRWHLVGARRQQPIRAQCSRCFCLTVFSRRR